MSKSEAVVIESIEVRELLRFLFYLDILNKLLLLQRKHSKYMYAKCLNFPCFITYLATCMHAFCMFYLYVSLGKYLAKILANLFARKSKIFFQFLGQTCKNSCFSYPDDQEVSCTSFVFFYYQLFISSTFSNNG